MHAKKFKQICLSIVSDLLRLRVVLRRISVCLAVVGVQILTAQASLAEPTKPDVVNESEANLRSAELNQASSSSLVKKDSALQLKGLRIRAHFDAALFDARTEKVRQSQLKTFCKSWSDALLMQKGPWGFGIASEVTCAIKETPQIELTQEMNLFDVWNLIVQRSQVNGRDVIEASICRVKEPSDATHFEPESESVKCEAKRSFPWSDFKVRFVRHRAFVRLVVASLYDQLPFLSVVSKSIVRFDNLRVEGYKEPETYEVSFPPAPNDVIFAEVSFDPNERRYALRAIPESEAIYKTMTQSGYAWLLHKSGRGARFDEFSKLIESAYLALTTIFQLDKLKFEKDKAKALAEKLKSRNYFDLVLRGEGGVGLPLLMLDSGLGGALSGYIQFSRYFGGGVKAAYESLQFTLDTSVQEKDGNGSTVDSTQVGLKETNIWAYGAVSPKFNLAALKPMRIVFGPRLGLTLSNGSLVSSSALPDDEVSIKNQELGIGIVGLVGWTFADAFELNSIVSFDIGAAIQSTTLRSGLEFAWILNRLVTPGREESPPGLRVGLGTYFSSLGREFKSSALGRSFNTKLTLSGLQSKVFVEQTL